MILALALAPAGPTTGSAFATIGDEGAPPPAAAPIEDQLQGVAADESQGPASDVKVHGHWTIDVRQPDGSLVSHTEFENALTNLGAGFLAQVLARQSSVGYWSVLARSTPVVCSPGCTFIESAGQTLVPAALPTLTVALNGSTTVLTASTTAAQSGQIYGVDTYQYVCPGTTAPSNPCLAGSTLTWFTDTAVASPVNVSAGQQFTVSVTISFS